MGPELPGARPRRDLPRERRQPVLRAAARLGARPGGGAAPVAGAGEAGVPSAVADRARAGDPVPRASPRAGWPGAPRSRAIPPSWSSPPRPPGSRSGEALAALDELVPRRAPPHPRGAALRVPPPARAPDRLRGRRRGVAARRARARRRRAGLPARGRSGRARSTSSAAPAPVTRTPRRCSSRRPTRRPRARRRSPRRCSRPPCGSCRSSPARTATAGSACSCRSRARCRRRAGWRRRSRCCCASLRLVSPDRVDLRVRLIAACASCENTLGRHEAAHARLLRALADLPGDGSAAPSSRSSSPPMRSSTATSRRWSAGPRRPRSRSRRSTTAGLRAITDALVCFAAYNLGRPQEAETARQRGRRGARRAARRGARGAARPPVLPGLRGVLLRALRRRGAAFQARHRGGPRRRPQPLRRVHDGRAAPRPWSGSAAWRRRWASRRPRSSRPG